MARKMNILEQKQNNLELVRSKARGLVSIVTGTISSLREVNQQIDTEIAEIDGMQASLLNTREGLSAERQQNEQIIKNFGALIGATE